MEPRFYTASKKFHGLWNPLYNLEEHLKPGMIAHIQQRDPFSACYITEDNAIFTVVEKDEEDLHI